MMDGMWARFSRQPGEGDTLGAYPVGTRAIRRDTIVTNRPKARSFHGRHADEGSGGGDAHRPSRNEARRTAYDDGPVRPPSVGAPIRDILAPRGETRSGERGEIPAFS